MDSTINSQDLAVSLILMELLGGLALFLYGLDKLTESLKVVAGTRMKYLLAKLTRNPLQGVFAGAFVTSIIQSSSVTTVMVVGFISANLMTLGQSIGVILGADIGTTITAQVVAFKVTHFALWLLSGGFGLWFCFKNEKVREYGQMIMGLGMIFFGMQVMSQGTEPLRTYAPFINTMRELSNPFMAILMAAIFTGLVQSSSATIGVIIALASQGFISLEAGIALAFGANIGTCVTAILAAMGKPREALRAALIHVLFKVVGVLLWLFFIAQLATFVRWMSPAAPELEGAARLAVETPRQIANAHTVFNVANTLLFIWFTRPLAALMRWLVPERAPVVEEAARPKFLAPVLLKTPVLAMDAVHRELGRLGALALRMVRGALPRVLYGSERDLRELQSMDNDVDGLHGAVITYLGRLSQENLTERQSEQLHDYLAASNYLENIGDMIETNLVEAGLERLKHEVRISPTTGDILRGLHDKVAWSVDQAVEALAEVDAAKARSVMAAKEEINRLASEAEGHLARRLGAAEPNRPATFRIETDIIENLRRVYYFAKRIAKLVAEDEMTFLKSREELSAQKVSATSADT